MGNNEWLDIEILDDYLEGKLDAGMMHKVERISLEDPFVAQALAGLTEAKKRTQTLSILQKQLQERVAEKPVERKMWRIASHRLSIAATAAVLFLTVSVLFWMRENQRQQQAEIAANKAKNIEIDLNPQVAAATPSADTVVAPATVAVMDKQKVEQALDKTLNKGSQAIASNRSKSAVVASAPDPVLLDKQPAVAKFKREHTESPMSVVGPVQSAPVPPVQALEGRVEGVQIQTGYATVRGKVVDYMGRPIPGANVKMVGEDARAITNVSGEFVLPTDKKADKVSLEVASIGYDKKNIEAKANQNLNIRLDEAHSSLNEVVVASGYIANKKNTVKESTKNDSVVVVSAVEKENEMLSQPKGGWEIFEDYLKNNNKLFSNSGLSVELGFSVGKDGRPTNIKILKGQDRAFEDEAIRLLKNGPKWNYNSKLSNKGTVTIKF